MLPSDVPLEISVWMKDLFAKQEMGAWQSPVHTIPPPVCVRTRTLSGCQGLASHQTKKWCSHASTASLVSLDIVSPVQACSGSAHFGAERHRTRVIDFEEREYEFGSVTWCWKIWVDEGNTALSPSSIFC